MKQQWLDFIEAWEDVKPSVEKLVKSPNYTLETVSVCQNKLFEDLRMSWLGNYDLLQKILGVYNSDGTDNSYIGDYLADIKNLADCVFNADEYVVMIVNQHKDTDDDDGSCWECLNNLYLNVKEGYVTSFSKIEKVLRICIEELGNQIKGAYGGEFYNKVFPFITIWGNTFFALSRYMSDETKETLYVIKRGVDAHIELDMRVTKNNEDNMENNDCEQHTFDWDSDEKKTKHCAELLNDVAQEYKESKERSECVWRICNSVKNKLKRGEYVSKGEFLLAFQMITADFEIDVRKKFKDWEHSNKYYKILSFVHSYFKNQDEEGYEE